MRRSFSQRPIAAFSLVASLLLHLLAALSLAWAGHRSGDRGLILAFSPEATEEKKNEDRVQLGIQHSKAVTMTWIGFEQATDHQAVKSVTEQPSLDVARAAGSSVGERPPAPSAGETAADATEAKSGNWSSLLPGMELQAQATKVREMLEEILQASASATQSASQQGEQGEATDAGGDHAEAGPGGEETARHDVVSDRQVDPTSKRKPVKIEPGQTKATQGLEIKTVRPRFGLLLRATVRPRNPVVNITFGPTGKVTLMEYARDDKGRELRTGSHDVDEVLENAIWRWTAEGKAINDLDKTDPQAGVTVTLEIVLIG